MSRCHSHLVYPQLGGLVRMDVVNCRSKPDHQSSFNGDREMMTWVTEELRTATFLYSAVKDSWCNSRKNGLVTAAQDLDLNRHYSWSCVRHLRFAAQRRTHRSDASAPELGPRHERSPVGDSIASFLVRGMPERPTRPDEPCPRETHSGESPYEQDGAAISIGENDTRPRLVHIPDRD
jgi:hypothetical protein